MKKQNLDLVVLVVALIVVTTSMLLVIPTLPVVEPEPTNLKPKYAPQEGAGYLSLWFRNSTYDPVKGLRVDIAKIYYNIGRYQTQILFEDHTNMYGHFHVPYKIFGEVNETYSVTYGEGANLRYQLILVSPDMLLGTDVIDLFIIV